jgi:DNA-binding transcriptional LysR family regulator
MDLLHHLKIFVDIADHGSLAAVARSRSLTPSAVTATLQRLEEHLGAKLILRSTRTLSLTPEGARFYQQCRKLIKELEEAIDQLTESGPLKGDIRLTSVNDFGRSHLPSLIDRFLQLHPQVHFDLSLSDEVVDLISEGFDLALRTGPLPDSGLLARKIIHGGRSICAAPSYWHEHSKPQHPNDLMHHNCLVLSRMGSPQNEWHFLENNQPLTVHVRGNRSGNDGGLLRQWAISGVGVILKSDINIKEDLEAGRLETALDEFKQKQVNLYVVHASGHHLSRRVRAFIEYLVEHCENLPVSL